MTGGDWQQFKFTERDNFRKRLQNKKLISIRRDNDRGPAHVQGSFQT